MLGSGPASASRGSLSVHIRGMQVGVMRTGLSGALVWAADLYDGSVRIARKPVPAYW